MTLRSLGCHPLSVENDTYIHVNFAQQLENLGFWQLGIFVLLHINESTKYVNWIFKRMFYFSFILVGKKW
jgi:hypothetical protein